MTGLQDLVEKHYANIASANEAGDREIFSPDVVTVAPGAGEMHGIDAFLAFARAFHQGFPDGHMILQSVVESGNQIVTEGVFVGTNTGPMVGPAGEIPPTNRRLELPFADFFRAENGKIVRHRMYFDQMVMLAQPGLLPEPAGASG